MSALDLLYFEYIQYPLRYKLIKNLKHSLLGDCQLMREKITNQNFIVKEKDCFSQAEFETNISLFNKILNSLLYCHPNLVRLHSYTYKIVNESSFHYRFYLIFEYLDQDLEKDLCQHQKNDENYSETTLWKVFSDLINGVSSLVANKFIQEIDIKPNNIFIYKDSKGNLSYKMFFNYWGLSPLEQLQRGATHHKFYWSPEEIQAISQKNSNFFYVKNEKSLVFCLGVLLLNLAAANATYEKVYRVDKLNIDENAIFIKEKFMFSHYSSHFSNLIKKCLDKNPDKRPSMGEILQIFVNKNRNNSKFDYSDSSFELCKPEELSFSKRSYIEKETLKQSLANGINKPGPIFDNINNINKNNNNCDSSFELKKSLLQINNRNLDDKLTNMKKSFHNRMTLLQDRISVEYNSQKNSQIYKYNDNNNHKIVANEKTAQKYPNIIINNNFDDFQTIKTLKTVSQLDYVSDNEFSEKNFKNSSLKTGAIPEIPEFILNLEKNLLNSLKTCSNSLQINYSDGSNYRGQVKKDSIREGSGVYYFANGDFYFGEWANNKINGKGVYYFQDGEYYEGRFVDFQRHGGGIYQYKNGNRYEGEWKNDKKSGFGLFIYNNFPNKDHENYSQYKYNDGNNEAASTFNHETYEGEWLDDEKHGEGIYNFANGDKFVGRWNKGKKAGKGMVLFADKSIFEGEWHENFANGYGVLKYNNGDVFEGNYLDGLKQGGGIYNHIGDGGSKYAGDWQDDERTGKGVYYYSNGDKYTGSFSNGKRSGQGEYQYLNGDLYVGGWLEDKKHGYGEFKFKKGGYYQGFWKENLMDGKGFMMYCNGDNYEGEWENGLKHGKGIYLWTGGFGFDGEWENDKMICEKGKFINQDGLRF